MAKIGSTIKKLAQSLDHVKHLRDMRDNSLLQKQYIDSIIRANEILSDALKSTEETPEEAIVIARQCTRFVLETLPNSDQDSSRATSLSQFRVLETMLAEVRRPNEYLANMQEQFGKKLDPRDYKKGLDAFSSIIKSQRQRLYAESQGFNTHEEKIFCRKRSELLAAVDKTYNRLRDQALGLAEQAKNKGRSR